SLTAPDILAVLRRIEARGAVDLAHRQHQVCGQVFRYAIATGRATADPTPALRGAIPPAPKVHLASIKEPARVGELLRALHSYSGGPVVSAALNLAPLVFTRPGELRHAEWAEIDFDTAEWRIPAHKMKMRAPHIVPLSTQAVAILRDLHPLTGRGKYVFPSPRGAARCMSENAITVALRALGYDGQTMTGHG
ncbi:phage integrase family protein, partial [mine drainage metagenome]